MERRAFLAAAGGAAVLPLLAGCAEASAAAAPALVMIVRHAEKPVGSGPPYGVTAAGTQDPESLTTSGWARSGALVELFAPAVRTVRAGLLRPNRLFAADPDHGSARSAETLGALAARTGLALDIGFAKGAEAALAAHLKAQDGVSLVAWEHERIPAIAEGLGAVHPAVPAWPSDRFDLVWTFTRLADRWRFAVVPQLLVAGDRPA